MIVNPEQPIDGVAKEAKNFRLIITTGLILLLVAIVGGYIYFGMQFAKRGDAPEIQSEPVSNDPSRDDIMKALENAPVASPEKAEEIMKALENAPVEPTSNREDVLKALDHPGV